MRVDEFREILDGIDDSREILIEYENDVHLLEDWEELLWDGKELLNIEDDNPINPAKPVLIISGRKN